MSIMPSTGIASKVRNSPPRMQLVAAARRTAAPSAVIWNRRVNWAPFSSNCGSNACASWNPPNRSIRLPARLHGREHQEDEESEQRADDQLADEGEQERTRVAATRCSRRWPAGRPRSRARREHGLDPQRDRAEGERRRDDEERHDAHAGEHGRLDPGHVEGDLHQPPPMRFGIVANRLVVKETISLIIQCPQTMSAIGDRDGLRHEREGHLLDLGDRLEQRDREADDQRGDEHGRGELGREHERPEGDVDDGVLVHG